MVKRYYADILIVYILVSAVDAQGILIKNAKVVDSTADPDIVEISLELSSPIDLPNSNLSDVTSQFLTISQIQTSGTVVSQENDVININFDSNILANQQIAAYNVTLTDRGEGLSKTINLLSTLTYFSSVNGTIITDTSTATICLRKQNNVITNEEVQYWPVAVLLILCLLFGLVLVIIILLLLQHFCNCLSIGGAALHPGKHDIEKNENTTQTLSTTNGADISYAIATNDVTESNHVLELCEVDDIINVENQLQLGRAEMLGILLDAATADLDTNAKKKSSSELKLEIKKAIEQNLQENKEGKEKAVATNKQKLEEVRKKHEFEIEKLKTQVSKQTQEGQDELLSLVNERHKLEMKAEEYITLWRLKQQERNQNDANDVRCNILCEKLDEFFNENEDHRFEMKESYANLIERGNKILEKQCADLQIAKNRRQNEIKKIRSNQLKTRTRWNQFGQVLINSIKTICRELEIDSEIRKNMSTFVREELVKVKIFFDNEMAKERTEYLKVCAIEKSKHNKRPKINFNSRGVKDDPKSWVTEHIEMIQADASKNAAFQEENDKYAIDTWNKKLDVVLKATHDKMESLKVEIVTRLGQNGASKRSVETFIAEETADLKTNDSKVVETAPLFNHEELDSKTHARQIILNSHDEVLRAFFDSQIYQPNKGPENTRSIIQNPQIQKTKLSLQRVRELIEYHSSMVEKKNNVPKQKEKRGYKGISQQTTRSLLEVQLENWRTIEDPQPISSSNASVEQFRDDMLSAEDNLTNAISTELTNQMDRNYKFDLLNLDLNALERLMMTLLKSLVSEQKLSPAECSVVIQEHKKQADELQKLSSQRTKRRLEQVVRKRFHSPPTLPFTREEGTKDVAISQARHHLNITKSISEKAKHNLRENNETAKEKYEVLLKLYEQQATELRELNLKVIQALVKVAKISSKEMNACLTLLLHHRPSHEIQLMIKVIYNGVREDSGEKSTLLPVVREMISQQKHRLAENLLRTDEDFGRTPIRTSNKLQRIKQPHRVTFSIEGTPPLKRDRLSPLPDIRPEPVGRTSSPVQESLEYQNQQSALYSNLDRPVKQTRRRKKKSLKNLGVAR